MTQMMKKQKSHFHLYIGLLLMALLLLFSSAAHAGRGVNVGAVMQGPIINGEQRAQEMQTQQQIRSNQRVNSNIDEIMYQTNSPRQYKNPHR